MKDENGLTPKQAAFVKEYLIDKNATQAAIRAGYSAKSAEWQGPQQLAKPHVVEQIKKELLLQQQRTEITADRVLRELANIAFADTRQFYSDDGTIKLPGELDDGTASALAGVDTEERDGEDGIRTTTRKIRQWDKVKALELLGKHLGLYPTRGSVSLTLDGQVDVNHTMQIEGRRVARRLILEEVRDEPLALPNPNTEDFGEEE